MCITDCSEIQNYLVSQKWQSELLNITGIGERPFPLCHFQVGNLLYFCLWAWGYWINWFLDDLCCPLLWCKEFLMILCCQRCWNHRSLQRPLVHNTWAGIMMKWGSVDIQQVDTTIWTPVNAMQSYTTAMQSMLH